MSMSNNLNSGSGSVENLYYSQQNMDNIYKTVAEDVLRRTNKDISNNSAYRTTFNSMAKIVLDKCPPNERNLSTINTKLSDKSVSYFHGKIFEKNLNKGQFQQQNGSGISTNTSTQHGFTMIKENEDIKPQYNDLLFQRGNSMSGNTNTYMPQPNIKSAEFVQNENFVKLQDSTTNSSNSTYEGHFKRAADTNKMNNSSVNNIDFTVKPFNLSEDMTESLFGAEGADTPLYKNIENLQKMDGTNPMTILEDYQRQRQAQSQNYINLEKRQNITALRTQPINENDNANRAVFNRNTSSVQNKLDQTQVDPMKLYNFGNDLVEKYAENIEKRIVNDNSAQPQYRLSPNELENTQADMIKFQRETQPKYIEKVHYININSVDRLWEKEAESRYKFQVKFNQNSTFTGAGISQLYRNIVSVELVSAIMPMDSTIIPFDTRLYCGIMKYPYLLLRIDELDNVFKGTNNWADKAFSTLLFDKVYYTNILSSDYTASTSSTVTSTPKTAFATEYIRGFMKFNPAYFEKKKFYNNPLASLNRMTITITDPRGNFINAQDDVLVIQNIAYTANVATVPNLDLVPSFAFPYSTQGLFKMIKITTTTYFSNRLFRIGDRILIREFATDITLGAINNSRFNSFINREEGHTIINLDVETNTAANTSNKGFLNALYISPPGSMDTTTNQTVDMATYYDNTTLNFTGATYGTLINIDLQSHLLFRIVTRDPDTASSLQSINVY